jgi:hypothetical protein
MCTLVILRRPDHEWPLILAANRDEMIDRPTSPPGRHWADRPQVVAGLDHVAGGSWFGLNDYGVVAAVMNREGSLGPAPDKRSRGELVLEALDHAEASEAAQALAFLDPVAYRAFNLFVADPVSAYWLRHEGGTAPGRVEVAEIHAGLHMLSARDLDDESLPRIRSYLPRFRGASAPSPAGGDWKGWPALVADRGYSEKDGPYAAMNLALPNGFGTRSSHLLALPRYPGVTFDPVFLYADGAPHQASFEPVSLSPAGT